MPPRVAKTPTGGRETGWISASDAAKALRMTPQSLSAWTKRPDAPVRVEGTRVWVRDPDFFRWREQQLVKTAVEDAAPADFDEARARKVAAEAQKVELELAQMRGQLVTVADFEKVIGDVFDRVRARVVALPGRLAPLVVGHDSLAEVVAAIEPVVAEVLSDLAHDPTPAIAEEAA